MNYPCAAPLATSSLKNWKCLSLAAAFSKKAPAGDLDQLFLGPLAGPPVASLLRSTVSRLNEERPILKAIDTSDGVAQVKGPVESSAGHTSGSVSLAPSQSC